MESKMTKNPWFPDENLNGWFWAAQAPKPEQCPILYITRSGMLRGPEDKRSCSWQALVEVYDVVEWFPIPLPQDVFGNAVKGHITLD
jgi:hypothetical protein